MRQKLLILFVCFLMVFALCPPVKAEVYLPNVIVYVPDRTDTELYNPDTHTLVWPNAASTASLSGDRLLDPGKVRGIDSLKVYFESKGYAFEAFEYDWRESNGDNARELKRFIDDVKLMYNVSSVDLLAHGMGGLIAKKFILDESRTHGIKRLISVGTPYLGSVPSLSEQQSGMISQGVAVSGTVVQSFASSYEMLPNEQYFNLYEGSYMGASDLAGDLEEWDHDTVRQHIEDSFEQGAYLYSEAEAFQDDMEGSIGQYVNFYRIIGDSQSTANFLLQEDYMLTVPGKAPVQKKRWTSIGMTGDGHVALNQAAPGSSRTWYVGAAHDALMQQSSVLSAVEQIFSGSESAVSLRTDYQTANQLKLTLYRADVAASETGWLATDTPFVPTIELKNAAGSKFVLQGGRVLSNPFGVNVFATVDTVELTVNPGEYAISVGHAGGDALTGLVVTKIEDDVNTARADYQAMDLSSGGKVLATVSSDFSRNAVGVDENGDGSLDRTVTAVDAQVLNRPLDVRYTGDEPPLPIPPTELYDDGTGREEEEPGEPGDGQPPGDDGTIDIQITGTEGKNEWYVSDVSIAVSTTITVSEKEEEGGSEEENATPVISISIDEGTEQTGSDNYTYGEEGEHIVTAYVRDAEGNVLGQASKPFKIDKNNPLLNTQVAGVTGDNGWMKSDVQVSVGATDEVSKLSRVDQAVDGASLAPYDGPIDITAEGAHSFYAEAEDNAGHVETDQQAIKIDKSKPVIADVYLQDEYFWDTEFPIQFTVRDEVSQVETVQATINGKLVENGKTYRFTEPGWHTYRIEVKDYAGWTSVYEEKFEVYIPVKFTFAPESLQLEHGNGMATSFVELPPAFAPEWIKFPTVQLNGKIVHVQDPKYGYVKNPIGDEDENGIPDMMFKYERESLVNVISPGIAADEPAKRKGNGTPPQWSQTQLNIFGEWETYHFKGYRDIRVSNPGYTPPPRDVTPPTVTAVPVNGAEGVQVGTTPLMTFGETVLKQDGTELTDAAVRQMVGFTDVSGQQIPFTTNWKKNSRSIQINPVFDLIGPQQYVLVMPGHSVIDIAGNSNLAVKSSFTTESKSLVFAPPLPLPVLEPENGGETPDPIPSTRPGGSSGSLPAPSISGTVSDEELAQEIANAQSSGFVTLRASADQVLTLHYDQISTIGDVAKPLVVEFADARFELQADALKVEGVTADSAVRLGVEKADSQYAADVIAKAENRTELQLAGDVYHLSVSKVAKDGKQTPIPKFNGKVQVSLKIPAAAKGIKAKGLQHVGRFNETTNKWDLVRGRYAEEQGTFVFETDQFSYWALMNQVIKTFTDISHHWAQNDIEFMATNGYLQGMEGGLFAPDMWITRAEVSAVLTRVLDLKAEKTTPFVDVQPDQWYATPVQQMYAAGLIQGMAADRFAPNERVTREQFMVMIHNVMDYKKWSGEAADSDLSRFADQEQVSSWAVESVQRAVQEKLVQGKPLDGQFKLDPQGALSRAEAAKILKHLIENAQWR